jgi:hypothetical protein
MTLTEPMTDSIFVKELKILWQNTGDNGRARLRAILFTYFGEQRANLLIAKMEQNIN